MSESFSDRTQDIKYFIRRSQDEMIDDLKYIVEIESPTDHQPGLAHVAEFLRNLLEEMGFCCQFLEGHDQADHLFAEYALPGKPKLFFIGHMDTVYPLGEGWPFVIRDRRAYGPGVIDMKSGLLSLIYALRALKATGDISFSASLLFNSDEEIGSPSSLRYMSDLMQDVDYAFVMEPAEPNGDIILRRKGIGRFYLHVKGISAHAGQQPDTGASAIRQLAHLIIAAEEFADRSQGTTILVGRIEGGKASHVVPDDARAEVDARVWTHRELERVEEGFQSLADRSFVPRTHTLVHGGFHRPPLAELPAIEKAKAAIAGAAAHLGMNIEFGQSGAASDGNSIAALGIPTLDGMGPMGGRAHSPDEYMEINSYFDRTVLLATTLLKLSQAIPNNSDV